MEKLSPTADQIQAIWRIVSEPTRAALNASTMGAGKTLKAVDIQSVDPLVPEPKN
jgi:N12 class adenine-specific DNA methylase